MVIGNISIATACRQCQDPVCMLCSRAGIARHPNGEVYITESCIGCGICAERCPYGAISIEDEPAVSSWQRFATFFSNTTVVTEEQKQDGACSDRDEQELDEYVGKRTRQGGSVRRERRNPPSNKRVAAFRGRSTEPSRASQSPPLFERTEAL